MKKMIQNRPWLKAICGILAFVLVFGWALILIISGGSARACKLDLDYGIAWMDDQETYYMPAEIVEIDQNGVFFKGSNGLIYGLKWEDFGQNFESFTDDCQWLLTMNSKDSHYWWDDEILAVWRA